VEGKITLVLREAGGYYIVDLDTGRRWSVNLNCPRCIRQAALASKKRGLPKEEKKHIKELREPRWMDEFLLRRGDPVDERVAECPVCRNLVTPQHLPVDDR